jgi:hypothetical protein
MKSCRSLIVFPLVALLAGCPGERPADDAFLTDADTLTADPTFTPGPGLDQPPAMGETAQMQDLQGTGVGGEVVVTDRGNQAEVMVRLTGAPPNSSHPGHIHSGSCANLGGVVQALEPITTDAAGVGEMTATVDIAPMTLMNGQHLVAYHGAGGAPIACADIPQHRM